MGFRLRSSCVRPARCGDSASAIRFREGSEKALAHTLAERLGRDLAARGLVILSGMARGIDAIGHHGALASNGRAIGVLGTGIEVCYPKENKKPYEKVLEPENFPVRNRIVAGMPLG